MKLMTLLHTIRSATALVKAPLIIANWPTFIAGYLSVFRRPLTNITLRNGTIFCLGDSVWDRHIVAEVWLLEDYYPVPGMIRDGDTVVDLGAHVGLFTLFAARKGAMVIAVEPVVENRQLLAHNVALNGLQSRVTIVDQAIAAKKGLLTLILSSTNSGNHSVFGAAGQQRRVMATTLDQLFRRYRLEHCRLLKCDIEGMEYEVLYSTSTRTYEKIDALYIETHGADGQASYRSTALEAFLKKKGFLVRRHFTYLYAHQSAMPFTR